MELENRIIWSEKIPRGLRKLVERNFSAYINKSHEERRKANEMVADYLFERLGLPSEKEKQAKQNHRFTMSLLRLDKKLKKGISPTANTAIEIYQTSLNQIDLYIRAYRETLPTTEINNLNHTKEWIGQQLELLKRIPNETQVPFEPTILEAALTTADEVMRYVLGTKKYDLFSRTFSRAILAIIKKERRIINSG